MGFLPFFSLYEINEMAQMNATTEYTQEKNSIPK